MSGHALYHCCIDLHGAARASDSDLLAMLWHCPEASTASVAQARAWVSVQLLLGRSVVPIAACDNFDYTDGCRGHRPPETA